VVLYELRGSSTEDTRTVQAQLKAEALNSHHVFILNSKEEQYIWLGEHASEYQKTKAKEVAGMLRGARTLRATLEEGSESAEFWQLLGSKSDYARKFPHTPRFFQGDNARVRLSS
jgi:villin 1/advillin